MHRIAVVSAILEQPESTQREFNEIIASYKHIVRGRVGIPFDDENLAAISVVVVASIDDINRLTGRLGQIPHAQVKAAISKRDIAPREAPETEESL